MFECDKPINGVVEAFKHISPGAANKSGEF